MEYRVALSYAREDARFAEYVGEILRRFLGSTSVFYYTSGGSRAGIDEFFRFINDHLQGNVSGGPGPIRTVCFVRKVAGEHRIVVGQETELFDRNAGAAPVASLGSYETWQAVTNNRNAGSLDIRTFEVVLPCHHIPVDRLQEWSVPFQRRTLGREITQLHVTDIDRASAEHVAESILRDVLHLKPQLHSCKAFTYEKVAIDFYANLLMSLRRHGAFTNLSDEERTKYTRLFDKGVPLVWPTIRFRTDQGLYDNPLVAQGDHTDGPIGAHRPGISSLLPPEARGENPEKERLVVSAALSEHHCWTDDSPVGCMLRNNLCFPEAGPRKRILRFGQHPVVGILVSGGIAPGINAVIDGVVRRHEAYDPQSTIYGFKNGLHALSRAPLGPGGMLDQQVRLSATSTDQGALNTAEHVSEGGSILGTFREERLDEDRNQSLKRQVLANLRGLDILYVIGGDGSMKAANLLANEMRREGMPVSIIGIPKTMDNDILWVWQTFGFATAVEKAREIIRCLSTEVRSNPRICVLQLFGSVSGFVVSHAVLSSRSGECDAALIPEAPFTIKRLAEKLRSKFRDRGGHIDCNRLPLGMIVMAEAAIPQDAHQYMDVADLTQKEKDAVVSYLNEEDYLDGQTSDALRSAGLKLVKAGLEKELQGSFRVARLFANEPRHILRASEPSFADIITGQRLGALAVDNAMAGYSDFMVSQWLTEFVLVPLRLVALGRKRIPKSGIFWKSVLAKTGQGELAAENE